MVTAITRLRKSLGAARLGMLYGRDNRRIAEAAEAARTWTEAARLQLPPLPPRSAKPAFEVHCVTGEKQIAMTGWSCWSLMRFLPEAGLVLHDDGSMTPESRAEMARILPGLRYVSREERSAATRQAVGDLNNLLPWIETYHFGFKHAVHFTAGTERIVDLDSDILTFADPTALRDMATDPAVTMAWNTDVSYSYAYPEALLREILGDLVGFLPRRLNGGLVMMETLTADECGHLDEVLRRLGDDARTDPYRYWMQQTLQALTAGQRRPSTRALPNAYTIYHGPSRRDLVMRHFVGHPRTRPRFFTEGVPRLISLARKSGHLPEDFAAEHLPL